ncbi:unnamed protein product [Polarella glacialis]|uniref:Uncharacterized protein n=1 Tax=Polarella glacialis TaxID=89957 RepID=A0A813J0D5_POLGL|nr:unnamed protein product [Polarella glacialis]CAE8729272.1 unnamed protein product [Polarella glacialis]
MAKASTTMTKLLPLLLAFLGANQPDFLPGGKNVPHQELLWRAISYNAQSLYGTRTLDDVLDELQRGHILGIQGTGLAQKTATVQGTDKCITSRRGFFFFSFIGLTDKALI